MHIATIKAANFCRFVDVELQLPETGVVVVRGGNGAGKSSLYEAVAWGLWGTTVRGTRVKDAARAGAPTTTITLYDTLSVHRVGTNSGGVKSLTTGDGTVHPTVTKAQAVLVARLGWTFDEWAMTQVFSTANPIASFARMKPAARVEALELLLGLHTLDHALALAREEARKLENALLQLSTLEALHRQTVQRAQERLAAGALHMEAVMPSLPRDAPSLHADIVAARDSEAAATEEHARTLAVAQRARVEMQRAWDTLQRVRRPLATACAACGRAYDDVEGAIAHQANEVALAEEALAAAEIDFEAAEQVYNAAASRVPPLIATAERLEEEWELLQSAWQEYDFAQAHNERVDTTLERELAQAEEALDETLSNQRTTRRDHATAALVVKTLGTSGVRATALRGFLDAFSAAANNWLARLSRSTVSLSASLRATPSGKQEVEVQVHGVGGGEGYAGASTGEQRRIDLALLFALSDIAAKAKGARPGTLWVDEVFDTLDEAGREAVAEVIEDVAKERCVVVITHEDAVAGMFAAVEKHVEMNNGEIA